MDWGGDVQDVWLDINPIGTAIVCVFLAGQVSAMLVFAYSFLG